MTDASNIGDPVARFFDSHVGWYRVQMFLERRALRAAVRLAEPLAGCHVIDLGAGSGAVATEIARRRRRVATLIAVDSSRRMLDRSPRHVRGRRIVSAPIHANVTSVPLPDRSADVVIVSYLLHLLESDDREQALAEAYRLLRPDGRLVAVVHTSPRGWAGSVYRAIWWAIALPLRLTGLRYRTMDDLVPSVRAAGFDVDASWSVPGVYWSQVLRARRPHESR